MNKNEEPDSLLSVVIEGQSFVINEQFRAVSKSS